MTTTIRTKCTPDSREVYFSYYRDGVYLRDSVHDLALDNTNRNVVTVDGGSKYVKCELRPYTARVVSKSSFVQVPSNGRLNTSACDADVQTWIQGDLAACNNVAWTTPTFEEPSTDKLLQKAVANAVKGILDAIVEAAEFHKTKDLVQNFGHRVRDRYNHVVDVTHSRMKGGCKATEFASVFLDTWMESRFGWRPLYYSAQDLSDFLEYRLSVACEKVISSGKAKAEQSVVTDPALIATYFCPYVRQYDSSTVSKSVVTTMTHRAAAAAIAKVLGWGVDVNVPRILWEITPYSWLVDYFLNIQDILTAHTPFLYSDLTMSTSVQEVGQCVVTWTSKDACNRQHTGYLRGDWKSYNRQPYSGDVPWNIDAEFDLEWAQVLDIVAVLANQLKKRLKPICSKGKNTFNL